MDILQHTKGTIVYMHCVTFTAIRFETMDL
jgi:hypothetical protein